MNATSETDSATVERAKNAKAGDKFQRGASRIVVSGHCDGVVHWSYWSARNERSDFHTPVEDWHRRAANTIANGAIFTPAD